MSNSSLVNYTKLSPNYSTRPGKISKITIHHMAGNLSVEACGNVFAPASRQASSNYGIGSDGRIGMYVEEKHRAWTSSNRANDEVAVTIEVANDGGAPNWHVSDKALAALIDLCVDICKRNGITKLNWTGTASGNLTIHKFFAATSCPGPYLESKMGYIAEQVNKRLAAPTSNKLYRVQVGAFKNKDNADALLKRLKAAGFDGYIK
jgi:N-acetyl-anhydromuramyl-L-alanine amidase AmpD